MCDEEDVIFLPLAASFSDSIDFNCGLRVLGNPRVPRGEAAGETIKIGYSKLGGLVALGDRGARSNYLKKNGVNVELKMVLMAMLNPWKLLQQANLDGNAQTLNDTISFAGNCCEWPSSPCSSTITLREMTKIIVDQSINSIEELKRHKKSAVEEGVVVDDFLLSLALEEKGAQAIGCGNCALSKTGAAACSICGRTSGCCLAHFPPFWLTALTREGSKELVSF